MLSSILPREVMRGLPVPVAQEAEVEVPKGKKLPAGKVKFFPHRNFNDYYVELNDSFSIY